MADAAPRPDEIVAHAAFVRRLARSLLRDEHLAEDVAQEALLVALSPAVAPRGGVRAWIGGVVRNLVRMELRGGARRTHRERALAAPPGPGSPADIAARLDLERAVVEAVTGLPEPLRTAIVLRYLDDLAPREIARRLDLPVETVKARLRRALTLLRERFDAGRPGETPSRRSALALLAGGGPGTVSWATGGAAMAAKTKSAVLGALLVGVLAGGIGRGALEGRETASEDVSRDPVPRDSEESAAARATLRAEGRGGAPAAAGGASRSTTEVLATGRISGSVRTADGRPVAGVRVVAAEAATEDPGDSPSAAADGGTATDSRRREALSGADGAFELTRLEDHRYHVTAAHDDFDVRASGRSGGRWVGDGARVEFVATSVVRVPVDVVGPDGPVDAATLTVVQSGRTSRRAWRRGAADVSLVPGAAELSAAIPGRDLASDAARVDVGPSHPRATVRLDLVPRPVLRGRILVPEGTQALYAEAFALASAGGASVDGARLRREGVRAVASSAVEFRFRFDGLPGGRYVVGAALGGGEIGATATVELGGRSTWVDLVLPEPDPVEWFLVRALTHAGEPVPDAHVAIGTASWTPPKPAHSHEILSAGPGAFRLRRSAAAKLGVAALVVVRSPSLGRRDVPFPPAETSSVDVRFDEPTSLEVALRGVDAHRRAGRRVFVSLAAAGEPRRPAGMSADRTETADDGRVTLRAIQPGEYELQLEIEGPAPSRARVVATSRITLRAGTNREELSVPDLVRLTVDVERAPAGVVVLLKPLPGGPPLAPESTATDAQGRAHFDALPPGRYHVQCTLGGQLCVATAEVPEDVAVTLRPLQAPSPPR